MVQKGKGLNRRTIVVTRPREQAEETVKAIEGCGGIPYLFPTIEIRGPRNPSAIRAFFSDLSTMRVDYVLLMSINGVRYLLDAAENMGFKDKLKTALNNVIIIAVGPKTAQELEKNDIKVTLIPEKYTSEGILQYLRQHQVRRKAIYIPRTSEAPPELAQQLRKMGNRVEEIHVYQSQLPNDQDLTQKFVIDLKHKKFDAILFSSSLGVKNFFLMLKEFVSEEQLIELIREKLVVMAIGPTTAKTLEDAGIKVDLMPKKHTINEALNMLSQYWDTKKSG